jgi:hypothetical protein
MRARLRAIGGTRLRGDDESEIAAIGGTRLRGESDPAEQIASTSVIVGPVSAVDYTSGTATVLNRTVRFFTGDTEGELPRIGEVAAIVDCQSSADRSVIVPYGEMFVPGVSEILISGEVVANDPSTGRFTLDGYTVDYSQMLVESPSGIDVPVGSYVTVMGTLY